MCVKAVNILTFAVERRTQTDESVVDTDFNSEWEINERFYFVSPQTDSDHTDRAAAHKLKYMNTTGTSQPITELMSRRHSYRRCPTSV